MFQARFPRFHHANLFAQTDNSLLNLEMFPAFSLTFLLNKFVENSLQVAGKTLRNATFASLGIAHC